MTIRRRRCFRRIICGAALVTSALAALPARATEAADWAELGRKIFFDPGLSQPAGTSCASCHEPARAFSGVNGSTVGVPRGSRPGHLARRTSPSLLYLRYVPQFRFFQEGDDPALQPFGGLFWDGRVDSVRELVRQPLTNPDEMNNRDDAEVAAHLAQASYAPEFIRAFGPILTDPRATVGAIGRAVEAYLLAPDMAPFSSRFDEFVRGRAELTADERWGLRLFKDPAKGNCASCHTVAEETRDPTASLFTDYGYDAVAAPRNERVQAAGKTAPVRPDLGLCERTAIETPSSDAAYCINFRTPSLRNVAVRASFMHNGAFQSLRDVVAFYASRDTDPRRWYRSGVRFDSVPRKFRGQVNVSLAPYGRREGEPPALTDPEIDAIVAFLQTLTDAPPR